MRTFSSVCAVTAAAAASLLLAPAAHATPPGDNGTVKIHDAGTGEALRRNEPHVCTFYLDAFGFDGAQEVEWTILEMPPTGTKGTVAERGALTLDDEGHGRSADLKLSDGHYKLVWNFDGEHGQGKHKVFWTDCEDDGEEPGEEQPGQPGGEQPGQPGEEQPGQPNGEQPGGGAGNEPDPQTVGERADGAGDDSAAAPAPPEGHGTSVLAKTGASVVGAGAAGALLLAAGGVLVLRRRAHGGS